MWRHRSRLRAGSRVGVFGAGLAAGALLAAVAVPARQPSEPVIMGGGLSADPRVETGAGGGALVAEGGAAGGSEVGGQPRAAGTAAGTEGPAGTTAAVAGADSAGGAPTRGVVRIGIGLPQLGAFAALGPNFDFGDPRRHWEAIIRAWREQGLLPVNGWEVEFVYRTYSIISAEEQRAACVGWATDDKIFAAVVVQYFFALECLPREHRIPLLTTDALHPEIMQRSAPYLFTLQPDVGRVARNWIRWAHLRGLLAGKRIGFYYGAGDPDGFAVDVKGSLAELGYELTEEVTTGNSVSGGPEDGVAAQRFRLAGVDLAILGVSSISQTNFMHSADAQGYRPTYIATDFFSSTSDTATSTFPPEHFDKTFAMTGYRLGEVAAGLGFTPEGQECIDRYERHTGTRIDPRTRPAEWFVMFQICDDAAVLLDGLRNAGPDLTRDAFVAGLEQIQGKRMALVSDVTFSPDDHTGGDFQRTLQWHVECRCYVALGQFEPHYVP